MDDGPVFKNQPISFIKASFIGSGKGQIKHTSVSQGFLLRVILLVLQKQDATWHWQHDNSPWLKGHRDEWTQCKHQSPRRTNRTSCLLKSRLNAFAVVAAFCVSKLSFAEPNLNDKFPVGPSFSCHMSCGCQRKRTMTLQFVNEGLLLCRRSAFLSVWLFWTDMQN